MTLKPIAVAAGLLLMPAGPVLAEDVPIDDPGWQLLSDTERAELVTSLRDKGIIGPEDGIAFTGKADDGVSEQDNPVLQAHKKAAEIGSAIASKAAYAYNSMRLKACKLMSSAEEKQACKDKEGERFNAAKDKLD